MECFIESFLFWAHHFHRRWMLEQKQQIYEIKCEISPGVRCNLQTTSNFQNKIESDDLISYQFGFQFFILFQFVVVFSVNVEISAFVLTRTCSSLIVHMLNLIWFSLSYRNVFMFFVQFKYIFHNEFRLSRVMILEDNYPCSRLKGSKTIGKTINNE